MSATATTVVTLTVVLAAAAAAAEPRAVLTYETGPAYIVQNDGRYGAAGTPYQAGDVGQQDTLIRAERATVELVLGRHRVVALYAPFLVDTRATLAADLQFRDTRFTAGTVVDHRYRFDGYRASYLYQLGGDRLALGLGGSLQIRSADVAFTSADGARRGVQSDIGLVPALKARLSYVPGRAWATLEVDGSSTFGLVGDTSGALYDVAVIGGYAFHPDVSLYGSLRLVGGGAEVPAQEIDNWANFVSASLGVRVELERAAPPRSRRRW
ncbi:MAG: hypothetical protein IPL61_34620 [Myxococcales bacterium]|nr:hypothetical protein [Myxococcales bacterium]